MIQRSLWLMPLSFLIYSHLLYLDSDGMLIGSSAFQTPTHILLLQQCQRHSTCNLPAFIPPPFTLMLPSMLILIPYMSRGLLLRWPFLLVLLPSTYLVLRIQLFCFLHSCTTIYFFRRASSIEIVFAGESYLICRSEL